MRTEVPLCILHHHLGFGVQSLLPVQHFQLHTNRVHGSILAQFRPVVWTAVDGSAALRMSHPLRGDKPIAGDLSGIRLV